MQACQLGRQYLRSSTHSSSLHAQDHLHAQEPAHTKTLHTQEAVILPSPSPPTGVLSSTVSADYLYILQRYLLGGPAEYAALSSAPVFQGGSQNGARQQAGIHFVLTHSGDDTTHDAEH
jgi:hypothetical protein